MTEEPYGGGGEVLAPTGRPEAGEARMRVAILAPPWMAVPPAGYGGTESVVALLTEELFALGHDVTLLRLPARGRARRCIRCSRGRTPTAAGVV